MARGKWKKVRGLKDKRRTVCFDPEHDPIVAWPTERGMWEYVCPNCGRILRTKVGRELT